jgi:hypothetical protein
MEQIAVTKFTKESNGSESSRNMMLDKTTWDAIVKGPSIDNNVRWELRQIIPIVPKEKVIIQEDINEVNLIAESKTSTKEAEKKVKKK